MDEPVPVQPVIHADGGFDVWFLWYSLDMPELTNIFQLYNSEEKLLSWTNDKDLVFSVQPIWHCICCQWCEGRKKLWVLGNWIVAGVTSVVPFTNVG